MDVRLTECGPTTTCEITYFKIVYGRHDLNPMLTAEKQGHGRAYKLTNQRIPKHNGPKK